MGLARVQRMSETRMENQNRELRVETLVKEGMLGEWIIENQNRELRVRTLVKGGMLGERRMGRIRIEN